MTAAWDTYRAGNNVPALLEAQMARALGALAGDALVPAVNGHNIAGTRKAAIDVAQASLDLQLRHRPPAEVDLARFGLWTQQVLVDAAGNEPGPVLGDVAVLEWVWPRFAHTVDNSTASRIEAQLSDLRAAANDNNLATAANTAAQLQDLLAALKPTS